MTIRDFNATVLEKKQLTHDVVLLSLQCPNDFEFKAGQFVTVKITNNGTTKPKSYSILNPPSQKGKIDLCVKIIPGGFASDIFEKTDNGEVFEIKGPLGHFTFNEGSQNTEEWFICAGTGVAPLYSMIKEYLSKFPEKKFHLIFSTRKKENLLFHEEFLTMQEKYPNFTYTPTLTKEEWDGKKGRVQLHLPEDVKDKTYYICGLKELVLETKELLLGKGVKLENIKFERYS